MYVEYKYDRPYDPPPLDQHQRMPSDMPTPDEIDRRAAEIRGEWHIKTNKVPETERGLPRILSRRLRLHA